MSPLLVVAVVLLVIVVGLVLMQRAHAERAATQQVSRPSERPAAGAGPHPGIMASGHVPLGAVEADNPGVSRPDALLGVITFDGHIWAPDDDVPFGDTTVIVEIVAGEGGPSEVQRELVRMALDRSHDLDARARAVIREELDRRGVGETDMDPYELSVRPDDDGRETGYLWYEVSGVDREMGVSSSDGWRTLALEAVD